MRSLAVETYKLTKKEDIQLFSCRSLRVGAVNATLSTLIYSEADPTNTLLVTVCYRCII